MRLGFDLDEVVVDLAKEIEKYLELNYGILWPIECFAHFDISLCKFDDDVVLNERIQKDLLEHIYDPDFQFQAQPSENAREVLQKFKKTGHKLYFITSRPKQNQPMTFKWLRQNDIPFDGLEVIGKNEPKGPYGRRLYLDMYVDDLVVHLDSMLKYKKKWRKGLLLFDKPWNNAPINESYYKRIKNWQEILRHVGIQNR
jgi:uncharacterized HAD superfamily protein